MIRWLSNLLHCDSLFTEYSVLLESLLYNKRQDLCVEKVLCETQVVWTQFRDDADICILLYTLMGDFECACSVL